MEAASSGAGVADGVRRVLVVGGAGFIGSHTVDLLLSRGWRVRVLDNLARGRPQHLPRQHPALELVIGDILCYRTVCEAMRGVDGCIHLAAQTSTLDALDDPMDSAQTSVLGFINVLEAAHELGVPRLVYGSCASVYGDGGSLPLHEGLPPQPLHTLGLERSVIEQYAALYARSHGLCALGLRYFNVYGPREDADARQASVIARFVERVANRRAPVIFGDGLQARDFIHVRDAARATVAAVESTLAGVVNVGSGRATEVLQVARILARHCGRPCDPEFQPARPGEPRVRCADVTRLREHLNVIPRIGLDEGIGMLLAERLGPPPRRPARHRAAARPAAPAPG